MSREPSYWQAIEKHVMDIAFLLDPGMTDFDVSAPGAGLPFQGISDVRGRFQLSHFEPVA
jgi:hypothetical protein